MFSTSQTTDERLDLEGKVLAAAFKLSFESGDTDGAALAHKGLCYILQMRLFGGGTGGIGVKPAESSSAAIGTNTASLASRPLEKPIEASNDGGFTKSAELVESFEPGPDAEPTRTGEPVAGLKPGRGEEHEENGKSGEAEESEPVLALDNEDWDEPAWVEEPVRAGADENWDGPSFWEEEEPIQAYAGDEEAADDKESESEEPVQAEVVAEKAEPADKESEPEEPVQAVVVAEKAEPADKQPEPEKAVQATGNGLTLTNAETASSIVNAAEEMGLTPQSQLPSGGPLAYLDFDDNEGPAPAIEQSPPAVPSTAAVASYLEPLPKPAESLTPSQLIKTQTYYQMLGLDNVSSPEAIHTRFLRLVRKMLWSRLYTETSAREIREFREVLRHICVAHDILKDPVTRTDYDQRLMGTQAIAEESPAPAAKVGTQLKLGELLACADIVSDKELHIALDMHKAEPNVKFGDFLLKAGFLNQKQLDATIAGQKLLAEGRISLAQYLTAMNTVKSNDVDFMDTLMLEGWLSSNDVQTEAVTATQAETSLQELDDLVAEAEEAEAKEAVEPVAIQAEEPAPKPAEEAVPEQALKKLEAAASGPSHSKKKAHHEESDESSVKTGVLTPVASPQPAQKAEKRSKRGKKVEFSEKWSEKDASAETQTININLIQSAIDRFKKETLKKDDKPD
jgi:hypothetical protein